VVGVEQWAEIHRLYFVKRLSIKEIVRRTGHGRNTIRRALRSAEAPRYRRPARPSKLDPFRDEIHRLLRADPRVGCTNTISLQVDRFHEQ
jgi:transposase